MMKEITIYIGDFNWFWIVDKIKIFQYFKTDCTQRKKLLNQQMTSAGIGTADFFCNIYRFFCWIHRLFVNLTDEPVKFTEMSVRITDFSFFMKSAILTDMSVDFTGSSVEFTNNLWIQQKNL